MEIGSALTTQQNAMDVEQMRNASRQLEAAFLSEFLKSADIGTPLSEMGGGIGEEQFSSYLRDEYARIISGSGGVGIAEIIFNSLYRR